MISIFSNYLEPLGVKNDEGTKPSTIYRQLRNAYNQGVKGVLENARLFTFGSDKSDEIIHEIWRNEDLHKEIQWINENVMLGLGKEPNSRINVLLRIGSNKLFKLVYEKKLELTLCRDMCYRFVENAQREMFAIMNEDLPF